MAQHVELAWAVVGRCCLCGSIKVYNLITKLDIQPLRGEIPVLKKLISQKKALHLRKRGGKWTGTLLHSEGIDMLAILSIIILQYYYNN